MKKYFSVLLFGAMLIGFTSCEEPFKPIGEDKNNVVAFCNSLIGLSVDEADRQIQRRGFTIDPEDVEYGFNTQVVGKMGPYSSTAGYYMYTLSDYYDENYNFIQDGFHTMLQLTWFDGIITSISYTSTTYMGSLLDITLDAEVGLYKIANKNNWDLTYYADRGRKSTRENVLKTIKTDALGHVPIAVKAVDKDYYKSLLLNNKAYGVSYTQGIAIDSVAAAPPSVGIMYFYPRFVYSMQNKFRYVPQALYMPDTTVHVGEYLHKASKYMIDNVIEETRVTYSAYNDEHPFSKIGDWDMGYYSCGLAYFAPMGALDLEANKVTHTSSNEAVLKVEQDECQAGKEFYEKIRIKAVAPGQATLTVRWKHLSTTATITVIE